MLAVHAGYRPMSIRIERARPKRRNVIPRLFHPGDNLQPATYIASETHVIARDTAFDDAPPSTTWVMHLWQPADARGQVAVAYGEHLGCTLFRLLTGSVPFPGHSTAAAMAHAHLEQTPPKPSELLHWASPALDEVVAKALAKRPADRYLTAGELAAAARDALSPSPGPSPATTPPPPRVSVTPVESTRPLLRSNAKQATLLGGAAAAVLLAIVLAWLFLDSHDDDAAAISPPPSTGSSAPPPLKVVLPSGYPPGACTRQASTDPGTEVVMACGPNQDPGGPTSGTYSLTRDGQSLQGGLAHVIGTATTVICPGNIQSPGPWRRLADPATPKGTLFCGIGNDGRPLIAWTFDPDRFLGVVQAAPSPDGLNALYAWWASHS